VLTGFTRLSSCFLALLQDRRPQNCFSCKIIVCAAGQYSNLHDDGKVRCLDEPQLAAATGRIEKGKDNGLKAIVLQNAQFAVSTSRLH
jgi:hypothetical protein